MTQWEKTRDAIWKAFKQNKMGISELARLLNEALNAETAGSGSYKEGTFVFSDTPVAFSPANLSPLKLSEEIEELILKSPSFVWLKGFFRYCHDVSPEKMATELAQKIADSLVLDVVSIVEKLSDRRDLIKVKSEE